MSEKYETKYATPLAGFSFTLLLKSFLIGLSAGIVAVGYRIFLAQLDEWRNFLYQLPPTVWWFVGMAILGLVLAWLARRLLAWAPLSGGSGIPQVRAELLGQVSMAPVPTMISKFIGGGAANLMGLSLGREGPSIQLGAVMGKVVAETTRSTGSETNSLITAGASAGLAAAFNAPLAGILFAVEELYGSFSSYILVPCLVASLTGNAISYALLGQESAFHFTVYFGLDLSQLGWVILLGVFTGFIGVIFNWLLDRVDLWMARWSWLNDHRVAIVFVGTLFVGLGLPQILGGGHHLVESLVDTSVAWPILLMVLMAKLLFTVVSYNSGVQGGIFLPVLSLGALFGAIMFQASSLDTIYLANFIALGMAGVLVSVVRAPVMAILLVTEMTGSLDQLLMVGLVVLISYIVAEYAGSHPVYETLYDKLLHKQNVALPEHGDDSVYSLFRLTDSDSVVGKPLSELDLPDSAAIIEVDRQGHRIRPQASDYLQSQDQVLVLHDRQSTAEVVDYFTEED